MKISTTAKNIILAPFNLLYKISPEADLKILFRLKQGYKLNLKNPVTYNEKLQWIKLYEKNPLMTKCCDKYAVREYVEKKGLKYLLNDLIWEGYNPEEIPFDKLPKKFVIKVTHGSTYNIICKDKNTLDREKTIKKLKKWLKSKFIPCYGEWYYGVEKPRIIIEKFIESKDDLKDYKVYCFNGKARAIGVFSNRFGSQMYEEMYDCNWKEEFGKTSTCPNPPKMTEKPSNLKEMLNCAEQLSKGFKHVRVDFFNVNNNLIFGEMTFADGSGFDKHSSYEYDKNLGNYLSIFDN